MSGLAFPQPRCDTCGERPACAARGRAEPSYPACHTGVGVDLSRVGALVDHWSAFHGLRDPSLVRLRTTLLEIYSRDRIKRSDVFEPSMSWDHDGAHLYRFSYGFPSFARERTEVVQRIASLAAPFGEAVSASLRALLSALDEPCVHLPIFGVAYDGGERFRIKLYLLFHDAAGDAAIRVAERLVAPSGLAAIAGDRPLHMLGIDLGPQGFVGAKLYFAVPTLATASPPPSLASTVLLSELAAAGVSALDKVLVIHRLRAPDDADASTPREIDFRLDDSGLCWDDVKTLPSIARSCGGASALASLASSFAIAVRRLSVSTGTDEKLNAYYVLREVDG